MTAAGPTTVALRDVAQIIRSKNAKPFYLTFDILFDDQAGYDHVIDSGVLNAGAVAELYRIDESTVRVINYPAALAIKVTIDRPVPAGSFQDRDLLGAQQAVPLYTLELPSPSSPAAR